jgi:hypothetical protein
MVARDTRPSSAGQDSSGQILWLIVSVVVALIGLYLLVQSTSMGLDAAQGMLRLANGMDSEQFYRLVDAQTAAYRLLGGILLGVGTARALFSLR